MRQRSIGNDARDDKINGLQLKVDEFEQKGGLTVIITWHKTTQTTPKVMTNELNDWWESTSVKYRKTKLFLCDE